MDTIIIIFNRKQYSLTMSWNVIDGCNVFAVLISDTALLEIDDPVIQFLNNSGPPYKPYKAMFQTANVSNEQILLRNTIAEAIETQFLPYIRNEYSEYLYKKDSN